jgi:hypothetical protein
MATTRFANVEALEQAARQRIYPWPFAFTASEANFWGSGASGAPLVDMPSAPATTTTAVSPTDATTNFPAVPSLGSSMYLTGLNYTAKETAGFYVVELADLLWCVAVDPTTNNGSAVDVSGVSFSARLPLKPDDVTVDYKGLELYAVITTQITTLTVNPTLTVGYTDGAGNSKTSSVTINTTWRGRSFAFPLDTEGVSAVNNYQLTGGTVAGGSLRVILVRPLHQWQATFQISPKVHGFLDTAQPQVFANSALINIVWASQVSGVNGPAARGYAIDLRAA